MATKVASKAAELAMPGWKAVTTQRADTAKAFVAVRVDSHGVDVAKLRAKYFGSKASAIDSARRVAADGEIVTLESSSTSKSGPKKLRVLVSGGKVTGVQG